MARVVRYCRLIGRHVFRNDNPDRSAVVECPEYELPAGACGIMREAQADGKLSLLLTMTGDSDDGGGVECRLR
jgi:hypothetical protein